MKRPAAVNDIVLFLGFNSTLFIFGGALFLLLGVTTTHPGIDFFLAGGAFTLCLGLFIGLLAFKFRALKPWALRAVRILLSKWLGMKGAGGVRKKLDDPELLLAFGLKPDTVKDPK